MTSRLGLRDCVKVSDTLNREHTVGKGPVTPLVRRVSVKPRLRREGAR